MTSRLMNHFLKKKISKFSSIFTSTQTRKLSTNSIYTPKLCTNMKKKLYSATIAATTYREMSTTTTNSTNMKTTSHHKVVILGTGPAGLTAALYTSRANLEPLLFEGEQPGGQLTTTTEVENYPGFVEGIDGYELVENMKNQCLRFGTIVKSETIQNVNFQVNPFELFTRKNKYTADSVIIATGASALYLGLENEMRLIGNGVSACATCDGFFYKGKVCAVIGGGDTAMEEALHLTKFATKVYLLHRRDEFRASKIMQDRVFKNDKISILWNTELQDVLGEEKVKGISVVNNQTNKTSNLDDVEGLFLAIGHKPNTDPFVGQLEMDETGYIVVEPGTVNTSINGVFACGDVQDTLYRQAITAAGTGCMAAMDAEKYLEQLHDDNHKHSKL